MKEGLSYDDVLLIPQYSDIESRRQVDIGSDLGEGLHFDLPVISSPMDTITESDMSLVMSKQGGLGLVHRYNNIDEQVRHVAMTLANDPEAKVGAAIGMTDDFEVRAMALRSIGTQVLCVDVAHGHHSVMVRCLKTLKDRFAESIHIMAGNVATLEAFDALASWGADSIRVGIGGGSICSTRLVTGHGIPTFQSLLEISQTTYNSKIIADGGIKTTGDMVKAFAAGADFVMIGSMLAGTKETPGEVFFSSNSGLLRGHFAHRLVRRPVVKLFANQSFFALLFFTKRKFQPFPILCPDSYRSLRNTNASHTGEGVWPDCSFAAKV